MFRSLLLFLSLYHACSSVAGGSPSAGKRKTDYIPCSHACDGGDVNFELTASIREMPMQAVVPGGSSVMNYRYLGRTYSSHGGENHHGFMGPTLRVSPGQSVWIKLRNNITPGLLGPPSVSVRDYWKMVQHPGEKIKYQYYKLPVDDPSKMSVDHVNMPHGFDSTNLHLHGLDVEVHMFDPVGTSDPKAPHVAVRPGECYCYRFNIPKHHPGGMYWYHPHLHGSTALQMWSGMFGLLYVDGPLLGELRSYGIDRSEEFVIWDPAFRSVSPSKGGAGGNNASLKSHNLEVDEFLQGQTTLSKIHPFLVNGKLNPTFEARAGEVVHIRVLVALVENENTFIVYREGEEDKHWDEAAIPFWVIAADGVTHRRPHKRTAMVMSGGMRFELLLRFDQPGRYVISQQGIQGMQFFDMWGHPHDQILATFVVAAGQSTPSSSMLNIDEELTLTPGIDEDIESHQIARTEHIVFSMGANRDQAPFPQYYVNGEPFDPDRLRFKAHPGEAIEYVLINANHNVHPFHIHVNRFQVKEMGSELSPQRYPALKPLLQFSPNEWRDTVVVPPSGRTRIWVHYNSSYTGKTVFHCHFLAHEDTGMMSTLFIGDEDPSPPSSTWWRTWISESFVAATAHGNAGTIVVGVLVVTMAVMAVLMIATMLGYRDAYKRRTNDMAIMKEMKSKALD